jgi:hypothetical protein
VTILELTGKNLIDRTLEESIKKAGLSRRADPCFGGDTCIV